MTANSESGAGIGTGEGSGRVFSGTVTINGGDVIAVSHSGKGIGAGEGGSDSGTLKLGAEVGLLDGSGRTLAAPTDSEQTVTRRASTMKTGVAEAVDSVSYMESGTEKSCEEYVLFTDSTTELEDGWYVVSGTVTVPQRISVSGDVSIILCDDAQLTGGAGIELTEGNTLSIYGQTEGSGTLSVTTENYDKAAIGSTGYDNHPGTLNIYGGQIYAESEDYSVPAVGGFDRYYGSLYFVGGKLVLANNPGGEALKVHKLLLCCTADRSTKPA